MSFKVLFLSHAPDADPEKHRCVIETPKCYKFFAVVVRDQKQALEACKKLVKEEGIQSILLCPGFTHKDVAEISEAVGRSAGVFVARGDGPSSGISRKAMEKEGWFSGRERK